MVARAAGHAVLVRKLRAGKKARVRGYTDERTTTWTLQHGADDEPPKQITPLRLLKFGKPELPLVISATFLSAICAFLNMSQNFFVGWLVDIVRFSDLSMRQDQLNWITFVLLAIYIADALLALFSGVLYTIAASRCSCRLRSLVLRNMLRQDVAFFDTVRIGELLNRLSTDTEVIQSVVTSNLVGWFIPSVQVIIGFVICFWFSSSALTLPVPPLLPPPSLPRISPYPLPRRRPSHGARVSPAMSGGHGSQQLYGF